MTGGKYRVGLSRDLLDRDGRTTFDASALAVLDNDPTIEWQWFAEQPANITADHLATYDAICLGSPGVPATALGRADQRTRIVARFGVGYDNCDVPAMTAAGVLLTINPDGVRRPVASSILGFILALFRLARPLEMRHIAYDPHVNPRELASLGVELCDLEAVLTGADFLVVNCPLNETTRGLIGARALGLMKRSAFLINTARGHIVDEAALYDALRHGHIAGAALDAFAQEPVSPNNPLLTLNNIIVSPHAICYTDECLRLLAEGAFMAARAFLHREMPRHVVNREVLDQPAIRAWFAS